MKRIDISILFLVLCAITLALSKGEADPDLWGHVTFGLDILESGQITRVDPYSYLTAGQTWINHEWLSEVLFGIAWNGGGNIGLNLLKYATWLSTIGILCWYLIKAGLSGVRTGIVILLVFLLILPAAGTIRPQMFTGFFFTLVLLIIVRAEAGHLRWLWGLPMIFALWVNFHGGFLAALGILGLWTILHLIKNRQSWRRILPPVLLSFLAILVNPYGVKLIEFLLRTATVPRPEIVEWQPLAINSLYGVVYLILMAISIAAIVYTRKKNNLILVLLFAVLAIMPWLAVRHLPLFAIGLVLLIGTNIADAWPNKITIKPRKIQHSPLIPIVSLIAGLVILIIALSNINQIKLAERMDYPQQAKDILVKSGIQGNLAVDFNWGEYMIWHVEPRIKVSMDGRRETVYSDEVYKQNLSFLFGYGKWDALLKDYPTDMALIPTGSPADNLLTLQPDWVSVYRGEGSTLFVRRDYKGLPDVLGTAQNMDQTIEDTNFP